MKTIPVNIAGQARIDAVSVDESTTAQDVLNAVGQPDYELSHAVGMPPFGKDEPVYDRVKPNGKLICRPVADVD